MSLRSNPLSAIFPSPMSHTICLNRGSWGPCLSTHGTEVTPSPLPSGNMLTQLLYLTKLNFFLHCLKLHHQNRARESHSIFPVVRFAYMPLYKNPLPLRVVPGACTPASLPAPSCSFSSSSFTLNVYALMTSSLCVNCNEFVYNGDFFFLSFLRGNLQGFHDCISATPP